MVLKNPYISILKLKGSIVDISVMAVTCAVLGVWDYRAAIAILQFFPGMWFHFYHISLKL